MDKGMQIADVVMSLIEKLERLTRENEQLKAAIAAQSDRPEG